MDIESYLGAPKKLSQWITTCLEEPGIGYWLVYKDSNGEVGPTLETEMFPVTGDTGDLSDEEYEAVDNSIHTSGYSKFLNLDQLEDIISNLTMQECNYSQSDIMDAIDHYFTRDAFLDLESG